MKHLRFARWLLVAYCLFDIFVGGFNGGFLPLQPLAAAQYAPMSGDTISRGIGRFVATQYNYSGQNNYVVIGNTATGSATITVQVASIKLNDGRVIFPYNLTSPIIVGAGANQELVTATAVSNCVTQSTPSGNGTCQITASFANTHGFGEQIQSGTNGLAEAAYEAFLVGGGAVVVDAQWKAGVITGCTGCFSSATAALAGIAVYPTVTIEDQGSSPAQYWNASPTTATFIATPTALTAQAACDGTHTFCSDASAVGTWTSGTLFGCVAYVDIMGNEGACSTTASFTTVVSKAVDVGAPAASAGAVGYTVYLSLIGGSYAFAYQVPITSSVCKLTTLETITPACAVTNATYGQTGSSAQVAAVTVNTSPLALQLGAASTTADYVGNSNARTTYAYVASAHPAAQGIVTSSLPFTAGPATVATTVPQVIGTLAIPAGFMNQVSKTIRICGKEQMTNASATVEQIQLWWDGAGSDAAGVPVNIANLQVGGTGTAVAYNGAFCWTGKTTVSGAGVTAGSILGGANSFYLGIASAPVGSFTPGTDTFTAATGSLNLAGGGGFTSRIHVVQLHTTGTDVSPKLVDLTLEVL